MILVLAKNYRRYKDFLYKYNLPPHRYYYVDDREKMYGIEKCSLLLMFEDYKAHPNYHKLIREARIREMDCIQVL